MLGIKNDYRIATHVNIEFVEIAFPLLTSLFNLLISIGKYEIPNNTNILYKKIHRNNYKILEVAIH